MRISPGLNSTVHAISRERIHVIIQDPRSGLLAAYQYLTRVNCLHVNVHLFCLSYRLSTRADVSHVNTAQVSPSFLGPKVIILLTSVTAACQNVFLWPALPFQNSYVLLCGHLNDTPQICTNFLCVCHNVENLISA